MDSIERKLSQLLTIMQDGKQEDAYEDSVWIDSNEVMQYLNISRSTFYRLKKEGIIVARKIGKRAYYFKSDLKKAFSKSIQKGRI
jgi:predicted DNA-binding transcriptional regulator AlpA